MISPTVRGWWLAALVAGLALAGCSSKTGPDRADGAPEADVDGGGQAAAEDDPWAGRDDLIQAPAPAPAKPVQLPPVGRLELNNGLQVLTVADDAWPVVFLHLVVRGGTCQEPPGKRSLASFLAEMLTKGTRTRTADQISEQIDFVGGKFVAWADRDGVHVGCLALSKDLDTCLELMPDVVTQATFPEDEMGTVRDRLITRVKQIRDYDSKLAHEHFDNLLWGEDNIRGWPWTVESINPVEREDLVAWRDAWFKPNNAVLAVAGDVDPQALKARLGKAFAAWKQGPAPTPKTYPEPRWEGIKIRLVDKPEQSQVQIRVGHLGLAHSDPDFLAATLINYTLGSGSFSSRLMKVVRSEEGKTYGAKSEFEVGRLPGAFYAWTFTRNAEAVTTLNLVLDEIRKMRDSGPTPQELADAKSNLAGRYPMKFETAEDVAAEVLGAELHGLSEDFVRQFPVRISQVSLDEAKRVAKEHLRPDNLVVVLVGKAADIEPQLKAAGLEYDKVGYLEPTTASARLAKRAERDAPADPKRTEQGRKLLDQALAAKGGADKVRAIKDIWMTGKGEMKAQGQEFEAKVRGWFQVPDRRRVEIEIPMGTIISVVTPDAAWGGLGAMIRETPAEVVAEERASLWRHKDLILLRHLESDDVYVQARDPVERDGKMLDVVELRRPDGSLRTLVMLDPDTHLIARLEYDKRGQESFEAYADYREVGGVKMAFQQRQEGAGVEVALQLSEVKINAGVPAGKFERPASLDKANEKKEKDE